MNRTLLAISATLIVAGCTTTPDCRQEAGFAAGLAGDPAQTPCGNEDYIEAHRIGSALEEMYAERDALLAARASLDAADRTRLRVLERDIPELETLARVQGLKPPSPLPGPGDDSR
jgi:hypothetical protein